MVEEQMDIRNGGCLFKQAFIEKGAIYGTDTLQEENARRCSLVYTRQIRE